MNGLLNIAECMSAYVSSVENKSKQSSFRILGKGILAGIMIALGAAGSNVAAHSVSNVGISRLLAGIVFPVGLMMVILLGAELFTGDSMMILGVADRKVKGLSVLSIVKDILKKPFRDKNLQQKDTETSLIEQFIYPKFGPGQLWENVAESISKKGGTVKKNAIVVDINVAQNRVYSVNIDEGGDIHTESCDYLLSSMPLKDLINAIKGVEIPDEVKNIAQNLPYRDFISVGVLVKELEIKNRSKIKTYKNRIPDTWIYIQEPNVKIGRIQVFNNWSPYMVSDYENSIFLGLEYFCTEDDELWLMPESEFINMAINELEQIHFVKKENIIDTILVKTPKAYPAYYGSYYELDKVKTFLDTIENLYCIGRNGQHRYNNMDHSMLTAMEAVKNIRNNSSDKSNIWNINTESDYHEQK